MGEYFGEAETDLGTMTLHLSRYRSRGEQVLTIDGEVADHKFWRRFSKIGDQVTMRFEDNDRGTTLQWSRDDRGPVFLTVKHDGCRPQHAKVDMSHPRAGRELLDSDGKTVDLQGDRSSAQVNWRRVVEVLADDPNFSDFLFGPFARLSGGVRVSGVVRVVDVGDVVPHAKVTLQWENDVEQFNKTGWNPKKVRYTVANGQGEFEFTHVHGPIVQIIADTMMSPNEPYTGCFFLQDVAADTVQEIWVSPKPPDIDDMFEVCDIIFGDDIGGLADCYAWISIYGG